MKKLLFITTFIFGFAFPTSSFAQGMPAPSEVEGTRSNQITSDGHTAREEAEGKVVWEKLQAKELTCKDLSDDNFETLGEYFMGQMLGTSHEAMNNMMIQMMGEKGEEQMHIAMGKRLSGCDTLAAFLGLNQGNPEGKQASYGAGNSMMNFGFTPFSGFGWIFMILWWVLIIAGIVALIKWLTAQSRGSYNHARSPLEILKERYAKGEIDKKEFEDRKKDLS